MGDDLSAESLEGLLRSMHEAVLLEDADRRVVFANEAFAGLFLAGAPASVMLGVDCGESARASAQAFRETSAWLERTEAIVRERTPVRGEPWQLADGRWLERDYFPRFREGAFAGHAWVYRDISAREEMRRQLADVSTELASTHHRLRTAGGAHDPEATASVAAIAAALEDGPVTVALVKLANLARMNAEAGRAVGDAVLGSIPLRVHAALPQARLERVGGLLVAHLGDLWVPVERVVVDRELRVERLDEAVGRLGRKELEGNLRHVHGGHGGRIRGCRRRR